MKQHSTIPNAFIDSFLSIYNPETLQTDFVVDLDKASKWIGVRKKVILQTLYKSYKEDIDYIIRKRQVARVGKYGGNNYKYVLLTPDCFKRICMRSRSVRAEEVRTYFIELESLLVRYRTVLLRGMDEEIQRMETRLKPKDPRDNAGYIYVIRASEKKDSVYKIGRTKDLNKRLSTYATGRMDGVDVVFKFRTDSYKSTENCLKAMLQGERAQKYKEVYKADLDMIKELIKRCDDVSRYKRLYAKKERSDMTGGYYIVLQKDSDIE